MKCLSVITGEDTRPVFSWSTGRWTVRRSARLCESRFFLPGYVLVIFNHAVESLVERTGVYLLATGTIFARSLNGLTSVVLAETVHADSVAVVT